MTLRWTHSIEKIVWEEDYRRDGQSVQLLEARVQGCGAGMEPPPEAVFGDGVWRYRPSLPPLPQVSLRHSPYVPSYIVCNQTECRPLQDWLPGLPADTIVDLAPCPEAPSDLLPMNLRFKK